MLCFGEVYNTKYQICFYDCLDVNAVMLLLCAFLLPNFSMLDKWKRVGQSWFDLKSELALQWSVKMVALDPQIVIEIYDITKKESL